MDEFNDGPESTAHSIDKLTEKISGLEEALQSRDVIGQAKGILMERFHFTSDEAFEALRHASQTHNTKLRDLAATVAETGQWPIDTDGQSPNGSSASR